MRAAGPVSARREAVDAARRSSPSTLAWVGGRAGGDRGPDGVDGAGEGGVVMGVVAAPDDALGADEGRQRGQRALVRPRS